MTQNNESAIDVSDSDDAEDAEDETYCYSCNCSFISNAVLDNYLTKNAVHNWCFVFSHNFASEEALAKVCMMRAETSVNRNS